MPTRDLLVPQGRSDQISAIPFLIFTFPDKIPASPFPIEVFAGMITDPSINFNDYAIVHCLATFGNVIGGEVFVALLKYSQAF